MAPQAHTHSFITHFQELNAHSVYHHLPSISQRSKIITGMLDVLTPAYQSYELRQCLPNSDIDVYMWSSHFTLMEHADEVAASCVDFILESLDMEQKQRALERQTAKEQAAAQSPPDALGVKGTLGAFTPIKNGLPLPLHSPSERQSPVEIQGQIQAAQELRREAERKSPGR